MNNTRHTIPKVVEDLLRWAGYQKAESLPGNNPIYYFFKDPFCVVCESGNVYIRALIEGEGSMGESAYRTILTLHDAAEVPEDIVRMLFRISGVLTKEQSLARASSPLVAQLRVTLTPKGYPPIETIFHHRVALYGPQNQ